MKKPGHKMQTSLGGFTLIEVCIVLVISGLALASAMEMLKQYQAREVVKVNKERIETIKQAMSGYLGRNNNLPCAARRDLPSSNAAYGQAVANCVGAVSPANSTARPAGAGGRIVRVGAVPVVELGLPKSYMADSWGNLFVYAVTEQLTEDSAVPFNPTNAAITIRNPISGASLTPESAMYTVISPGKNAKGAWTTEGKQPIPCTGTGHDTENCNDTNATFNAAPFSTTRTASHFDDLVSYSTAVDETIYPICAADERLTSTDGLTFTCAAVAQPPICGTNQRLTSDDGVNFSCLLIPMPVLCAAANEFMTSPDGVNFVCAALPAVTPPPPTPFVPLCNGVDQALTSTGGNFICTNHPISGGTTKTCTGYNLGGGRYGCAATCDAGDGVTGGSAGGGNVRSDQGQYSGRSGNGWECWFESPTCWSGALPCGITCSATCTDVN